MQSFMNQRHMKLDDTEDRPATARRSFVRKTTRASITSESTPVPPISPEKKPMPENGNRRSLMRRRTSRTSMGSKAESNTQPGSSVERRGDVTPVVTRLTVGGDIVHHVSPALAAGSPSTEHSQTPNGVRQRSSSVGSHNIHMTPRTADKLKTPRTPKTPIVLSPGGKRMRAKMPSISRSPTSPSDRHSHSNSTPTMVFSPPTLPNGATEEEVDELLERTQHNLLDVEGHIRTKPSKDKQQKPNRLYTSARRCQWGRVLEECHRNPRDAQYVSRKDGTTALHLAVLSRSNPQMRDGEYEGYAPAPLDIIEELLMACPEAAIMRCHVKSYTPLSYACLVGDKEYDMDSCAEIVRIILHHAPQSAYVFTDDGLSALDVHILSYSRFHREKHETYSGGRTSTVVLRTLLAERPDLSSSRVYKNKVRGPIELLYRSNTEEFKEAIEDENAGKSEEERQQAKKIRCASVASMLTDWWAWKWALLLLKFSTIEEIEATGRPFSAVHAAGRLVGCPLPILILAVENFPDKLAERDPKGDLYNLPLHDICSWEADQEKIAGDPFVQGRKAKAIQYALKEYPEAARMTNNMGETPLQLAIETCTPWHGTWTIGFVDHAHTSAHK